MGESLNAVILRKLMARLGAATNEISQWINNETLERLDERQRAIQVVTLWAQGLPSGDVRREYLDWLQFWQNGLNAAYHELRTGAQKQSHEKWRAEQDARRRAVSEFEQSHDIPEPPK